LVREVGIKFIVRFSYNDGTSAPNTQPDATLAQVLRHIEQLAPILEANKDVIAWFEAGFIGAWGEWHSSTNGLDSDANKAIIRDALLANFPADRFILFRYPGDFIGWHPQPLTEAQAFSGTDQARAGHHNDCFLASDSDFGTYPFKKPGEISEVCVEQENALDSNFGNFLPQNIEMILWNLLRQKRRSQRCGMESLHRPDDALCAHERRNLQP
jgi:hypothetical protein